MAHRRIGRAAAVPLLLTASLLAPAAFGAEALPPQLVAKLEADRAAAQAELADQRRALPPAATRHPAPPAPHDRMLARTTAIEAVLETWPARPPGDFVEQLDELTEHLERAAGEADAALAEATEEAARAQARALDSDRRLRALRRASATQDDVDATLGSWRFGSGGPAVSAASLDEYLASKGSPMAGEGDAFLKAGVEHEVDPRLVVAIAGAESYFGIITCAPHNGWGWGCPNSPFSFESWAHGFDTVTRGLRENYLDDGLETVGEIHLRYAPPDAANDPTDLNYGWADNVARFLVEQGGDPQHVAGVVGPSN